jgi:hypothetical protein
MPDRNLQGDVASVAIAEEIGTFDLEVPEKGGDIVRVLLKGQWTIDVGRVPVSLQFDGDDLPGPCKGRQNLSERGVDRRAAAVQQAQRLAFAADLSSTY